MDSRVAKSELFDAIAGLGKALSSARRLELIDLLAQSGRSVDELAEVSGLSVANTSQHLQALHAAGVVSRRREGTRVHYALAGDDVLALWVALRDTAAERLAEVERAATAYLGEEVDAVGADELLERLERGDAVLVDVRPEIEFRSGHIAGAMSLPLDQLEARISELPEDVEIVAYCRGRFCAFADAAVRRLLQDGRAARRLDGGWPEWKLAGAPVEQACAQ
jgi:rhodanese-related sulfurtransferase/predicted transcriptional regulator